MDTQRAYAHTVSDLIVHIVWSTKYRYRVLQGDIQKRCREILKQISEAEDIVILKGVVSQDHIHMHINYLQSKSFSQILKKLKSRSSIKLQQEFPDLRKRYWCQYFWAIGYGCWSTGNITDEIVNEYLKHNRKPEQGIDEKFILE